MARGNTVKNASKRAHSVSVGECACGCGGVYLALRSRRGRMFAEAWIEPDDLLRVADELRATAVQRSVRINH